MPADDRALGYQVDPYAGTASEEPLFTLNATAPLGGLWSTVADMARYAAYVANPDDRVVRPETVEEMCRPIIMTDVDGWSGAYGLGFGMGRRGDRVYVGHGGAMPGFLTGLRVRRRDRRRRDRLRQRHVRRPDARARDRPRRGRRRCRAVARPRPGCPRRSSRRLTELLGLWWSEGSPITFFVRDGELWSRLADDEPLSETRYAAEGTDRFRAVAGRERGEVLEVVRAADGSVDKLYFATYAVTRAPLAFADLQG